LRELDDTTNRSLMCLGVYLATDVEQSLIPFDETRPGFNAGALTEYESAVADYLKSRYVYRLGSHTHCGCGFMRNGDSEPQDVDASRSAMGRFVAAARSRGPCRLFVYWTGDPLGEPVAVISRRPADLVNDEEWIVEGTLTNVLSGD